ncbi:MAG: hypothetical protein KDE34_25070, partial [Anaerolineales bacterium]|nr:hypothetical protein [Anaerolineales bacterium]
ADLKCWPKWSIVWNIYRRGAPLARLPQRLSIHDGGWQRDPSATQQGVCQRGVSRGVYFEIMFAGNAGRVICAAR